MIVVVEATWTRIAHLRTSRRIVTHIAGDTRRAYVSVVIVLTRSAPSAGNTSLGCRSIAADRAQLWDWARAGARHVMLWSSNMPGRSGPCPENG